MAKVQQGLPLAGLQKSAEAFDRAVADYYALTGDPVGVLKDALAGRSNFALGGVAIAGLFMIGGFRGDHPEVVARDRRGGGGDCARLGPRMPASRSRQGQGGGPVVGGDVSSGRPF